MQHYLVIHAKTKPKKPDLYKPGTRASSNQNKMEQAAQKQTKTKPSLKIKTKYSVRPDTILYFLFSHLRIARDHWCDVAPARYVIAEACSDSLVSGTVGPRICSRVDCELLQSTVLKFAALVLWLLFWCVVFRILSLQSAGCLKTGSLCCVCVCSILDCEIWFVVVNYAQGSVNKYANGY